ncbi:PLP-dependent aminotransferase family protein [Ihubacter sp. mB4P-1]|uniref:aminotransferase-like domain-containing protein n=1 Tax=Ihubacter sp. mB4P-1 TaxID=3242370 RepID=UPI00137A7C20
MQIIVDKESRTPIYWQIADQIKEKIISGQLPDGSVLPSERAFAQMLGVHRNTIIKAYAALKDEELVESVRGVGYQVSYESSDFYEPDVRKRVNWSAMIKDEYQDMERTFDDIFQRSADANNISFSTGLPPAVYEEANLAADFVAILNEQGGKPSFLTPYQGDLELRQRVISYLRTKGIKAGLNQVQILSETNQALDFIVTTLLKEGDKVIIEEPVSPDVYRVIRLAGCKAVTVPVDEDGMVCDHLEALIESHRPKFIYVNSSYHDPTGNILSVERRKKLLEISNRYRLPIVEEDAASELSFEDVTLPTLKAMDRSDNVIYIYSFSLTFVPGLSMAFVVAPEKLIKSLSYLVSIRMMTLDWITQKLLAKYITSGKFYENARRITSLNRERRDLMCEYLDRLVPLGLSYQKPRGGVYVWCRLPAGVDGKEVAAMCMQRGISVVPGDIFFPNKNGGRDHIRLNYSFETKARIRLGMENMIEIITELASGRN